MLWSEGWRCTSAILAILRLKEEPAGGSIVLSWIRCTGPGPSIGSFIILRSCRLSSKRLGGNACCKHPPYPCIELKAPGPLRDSCILALHPTLDRIMFTEVRNNTNRTRTMNHRTMDGQISSGCRNVPLLCSIRYAIPTSQRLVSRSIISRDHCSRTRRFIPVYGCLYILQMFLCRSR